MSSISHFSRALALILMLGCFQQAAAVECVVLLHGLARTEGSLSKLEQSLERQGFVVVNDGYASRYATIEELSPEVIRPALEQCVARQTTAVHFVTHSLGGILVRYFLAHHEVPNLGRVVMLSPPNGGSEVVDRFESLELFRWLNGPAGRQLGTDERSIPRSLGAPDYEVGIITGDRSINLILSLVIPGRDDGKVSVENAKLSGMKDFLVVHRAHPFIMNDDFVLEQVSAFIANGAFARE